MSFMPKLNKIGSGALSELQSKRDEFNFRLGTKLILITFRFDRINFE